ncbi:hypothetical protein PhCBS80983_g04555 [Powellomyces hirtus]|uniref:Uncharacterized protein n=1 Tax=Powellomyces hirtus TaxID=109895 RepID=A0A507DYF6_9FUNG|nr:hypothetical protein PhCBS80983_g04555 [Powellomyces hirtus]
MPTHLDILHGTPLPTCPYASSSVPPPSSPTSAKLHNPNVSLSFLLIGTTCLVLAILVKARYDGARVFNRYVADKSVRNARWAVYFAVVGTSFLIDSIRYALDLPHQVTPSPPTITPPARPRNESTVEPQVIDAWLLLSSAVLRSFAVLVLTLALHYQLRHRSNSVSKEMPNSAAATAARRRESTSNNPSSAHSSTPASRRPSSYPTYNATDSSTRRASNDSTAADPAPNTTNTTTTPTANHAPRRRTGMDEEQGLLAAYRYANGETAFDDVDDEGEDRGMLGRWCGLRRCVKRVFATWGFVAFALFVANLAAMYLAIIRPPTQPGQEPISDHNTTSVFFLLNTTTSIIQHLPPLILAYYITTNKYKTTPSTLPPTVCQQPRVSTSSRHHHRHHEHHPDGPTFTTRTLVAFAALLSLPWIVEPSILARAIKSLYQRSNNETQHAVCIVPPWWWIDADNINDNNMSTQTASSSTFFGIGNESATNLHGWASNVDLLIWAGFVAQLLWFEIVRREWRRNKEEWVWLTVSELQSVFDFRRY